VASGSDNHGISTRQPNIGLRNADSLIDERRDAGTASASVSTRLSPIQLWPPSTAGRRFSCATTCPPITSRKNSWPPPSGPTFPMTPKGNGMASKTFHEPPKGRVCPCRSLGWTFELPPTRTVCS
jgi:hypothetical protein